MPGLGYTADWPKVSQAGPTLSRMINMNRSVNRMEFNWLYLGRVVKIRRVLGFGCVVRLGVFYHYIGLNLLLCYCNIKFLNHA